MIALWKAMGKPTGSEEQFAFAAPEPIPECDPEMANAFRQAITLLRRSGMTIKSIDIAGDLKKLVEAGDVLEGYEGARVHEARLKEFGDRLDPAIANLVRNGLKIPAERYDEAKRFIAESRIRFAEIFKSTPVILTPAAVGSRAPGFIHDGRSSHERALDGPGNSGSIDSHAHRERASPRFAVDRRPRPGFAGTSRRASAASALHREPKVSPA